MPSPEEHLALVRTARTLYPVLCGIAREQYSRVVRDAHAAGLSYGQLAHALGISRQRVYQIAKGQDA
ncbi:helix-turn-helix domain-containing protein [Mycobacteroides abscessus]|uniref:helix-turn-helix domain-containing protein n=1 Tax=Mycobacteroides abscessus TaxID=36809 RepID=UPI0009277260|nr:helix-turn-helix transcriptional regulator [Mycobacteroides abscessus]SIF35506.1 Uncharacterised protein [Mycobacteroides abscessus subsp. abscessus]